MATSSGTEDDGATTALAAPPPAPAGHAENAVNGIRRALSAPNVRRLLGWALVVGWVLWLVALWLAQPRVTPQAFFTDELERGQVTAYRVVLLDEDPSGLQSPYRLDVYPASDAADGVLDGAEDGRPVTVAYWVDAPVADLRVVDTNGLSSEAPTAMVAQLKAAGVPEADLSRLWGPPPGQDVYNAGSLLLVVSTLVVILGPRPRRGTRWFWFWVVGGPLSIGVPLFAVTELLRPRHEPEGTVHPPGVAGRWSGLLGFAAGFLLSAVGAGVLVGLTSLSPVWFIRG